jgi:hypothetical protein
MNEIRCSYKAHPGEKPDVPTKHKEEWNQKFLQNTPRSENRCSYKTHPGMKPYIPSKTQPGWETRYSNINPTGNETRYCCINPTGSENRCDIKKQPWVKTDGPIKP